MTHRSVLLVALVAIAATLVLAGLAIRGASTAEAHAVQVSSSPAPNEQLAGAPGTITIRFSEPIEPSVTTVQLWDTSPAEIPLDAPSFPDDMTMEFTPPQDLAPGIYTVIWRNLSTVDAHTWSGSFPFTILGPNGEVPEGAGIVPASLQELAAPPSDNPSTLESTARWIVLLGTAVMLGGAAYVLIVAWPAANVLNEENAHKLQDVSRTIVIVTSAIAIFLILQGSLVQLLLQADRLGGLGKTDDLLTDTRFGEYLIARQILLAIALLAVGLVWRAGKGARATLPLALLATVSFGVLLTLSLVSHAAGADGAFWKVTADVLHLLTASLWVGGLIHIGLAMPRWLDELRGVPRTLFAAESFRRFSVLAAFSVLVLMISGVLSALAQFHSFDQLWETTYGKALIGKIGVMLPLLVAAGINGFMLQPRIIAAGARMQGGADDSEGAASQSVLDLQRLLSNTVRIEAVLGIAILVAVAVMIQLEPPRAIAEAEDLASEPLVTNDAPVEEQEGPFIDAAQAEGLVVSLEIDPFEVGENRFEVGLGSEFGSVGEIELVRLDFIHPEAGQSSLELPLAGSAKFEANGANLSLPGAWEIEATVRRRGEDVDVLTTYDAVLGGGDALEETADESTIWSWPFEDRRSAGAVAALAVGGVGLVAVAGWQMRNIRRT